MKIVIRRGALPHRRETSLRNKTRAAARQWWGKSGCRAARRSLQGGGIDGFGAAGNEVGGLTGGGGVRGAGAGDIGGGGLNWITPGSGTGSFGVCGLGGGFGRGAGAAASSMRMGMTSPATILSIFVTSWYPNAVISILCCPAESSRRNPFAFPIRAPSIVRIAL